MLKKESWRWAVLTTSNPALICTAFGHESVFIGSTMPSSGLNALLAMPVLKLRDGMSRIAVPVVSEPVPAVVWSNKRDNGRSYRSTVAYWYRDQRP